MNVLIIVFVTIFSVIVAAIGGTRGNSLVWQAIALLFSSIISINTAALFEKLDAHGQDIKTWFKSNTTHRNKDIYLSFSYLYKIEINGKYLLVRGNRMKDRYQPVGGVYKFYDEARPFLNSIHYQPDTMVGNNNETDDLRIRIKGKYLLLFLEWFLKMENREYGPEREFYEELVAPGFIAEEKFRHLRYRKVDVHNKGIMLSDEF